MIAPQFSVRVQVQAWQTDRQTDKQTDRQKAPNFSVFRRRAADHHQTLHADRTWSTIFVLLYTQTFSDPTGFVTRGAENLGEFAPSCLLSINVLLMHRNASNFKHLCRREPVTEIEQGSPPWGDKVSKFLYFSGLFVAKQSITKTFKAENKTGVARLWKLWWHASSNWITASVVQMNIKLIQTQ